MTVLGEKLEDVGITFFTFEGNKIVVFNLCSEGVPKLEVDNYVKVNDEIILVESEINCEENSFMCVRGQFFTVIPDDIPVVGTIVYKYTRGDKEMRKLKIELDGYHSSPTQAIRQSDYINAKFLVAGVAETETAPAGARIVLFSSTDNFYLNTRAAAVIPTDDIIDGSAPEYNPVIRSLITGETMSLIAPANCIVMMAYYK